MIRFAACACYLLLRFTVYSAKYMYVVAAVSIIATLQVQHNFVEVSYLYFELGAVTTIILTSPISDFINRRTLIIIYFGLAIIGTLLISWTQSAWIFYLARFIEGLGLGNLFSIGNAIVYDIYAKNKSNSSVITNRILSKLGIFSSFFIVLNLFVFALLSKYYNWRELFFVLSILIMCVGVLTCLFLIFFIEPLRTDKKITLGMVSKEYWQIISDFKTLCYSLVFSFSKTANTLLYLLLTSILIHQEGYDAVQAALYIMPLAVANLLGKQLNVLLVNQTKPRYILFLASLIQFLPMSFVLIIALFNATLLSSWLLIIACTLMTIGTGLVSPLSNSRLMALFPDKPNMANNMLTLFTGLWVTLFTFLAEIVGATQPIPFIILIFALTAITIIVASIFVIFHPHDLNLNR